MLTRLCVILCVASVTLHNPIWKGGTVGPDGMVDEELELVDVGAAEDIA
jgi:hypothetical protein